MVTDSELELDLEELGSAEEFLDYFDVPFDASVVHVNRLHILQRFHDYIHTAQPLPEAEETRRAAYGALLERAYLDFVNSDAVTEKVFRVFHMHEPQTAYIPVEELVRR